MQRVRKFNPMNLLLVLVFVAGLGVMLYPNISNFFNERNSSKATSTYDETVAQMNEEQRQEFFTKATDYNKTLIENPVGRFTAMTQEQFAEYMSQLNVDGNGMMCYLKIDKLGVNLPVYHGTTEEVLQKYVGHVEGTSLPIGGLGTHCALSGHRGLPSAVLFTNLDKMEINDTFTIMVLGESHTYIVDQIETVLPNDMSKLEIDPDKDFCTLITCTPYGVNTHRLMVRGVRVPDTEIEEIIEQNEEKIGLTREKIVNIIAGVMTFAFLAVAIPIFIFPVVPQSKVYLRPWDDNIKEVYDSAITVSDRATRANWAMDDITTQADRLASQRRWDETLTNREALSEKDNSRNWNEYRYEEDYANISKHEEENYREWDNEVLEKVDQDWAVLDRNAYKNAIRYTEIKDIVDRGTVEAPEQDMKPFFEKEMEFGKEILQRSKNRDV